MITSLPKPHRKINNNKMNNMSLDYSYYMQGGYQTLPFPDWPCSTFHNPSSSSKNKVPNKCQKRRRAKNTKNKEEMENERMAHIAVERNRRRLMNEYLAILRSLMPPSYAQRGDQSSIVGGAINFVKVVMKRRAKQLVEMVARFQSIGLSILHLSVTTDDLSALYSFSLKVENVCELSTANEIATAVHDMVGNFME